MRNTSGRQAACLELPLSDANSHLSLAHSKGASPLWLADDAHCLSRASSIDTQAERNLPKAVGGNSCAREIALSARVANLFVRSSSSPSPTARPI